MALEPTRLKVAVVTIFPYVTEIRNTSKGVEADGLGLDVLKILSQSLNFTYELYGHAETLFGREDENGIWTGQVGKVQRGEFDMICPFAQHPTWSMGTGTTKTLNPTCTKIIGAIGRVDATNFAGFITTFDKEIWYYFISLLFVSVFVCAFSDVLRKGKPLSKASIFQELSTFFWMFVSATFSEGSFKVPFSVLSEFMLGLWLVGILTLSNAFMGQFKAMLMTRIEEDRVDSVKDLGNRPELIPFVAAETLMATIFEDTPEEDYQRVWQNMLRHKKDTLLNVNLMWDKKMYQRVMNGEGVSLVEHFAGKSYIMRICNQLQGHRRFYVSKEEINPFLICYGLRPTFPVEFHKRINQRIQWLIETHIIYKLHEDSIWKFWQCEEIRDQDDQSLKLKNLLPIFYFLLITETVSGVCLLVEIGLKRFKRPTEILEI